MLLEIILAVIAGILIGTFTGLIPSLHVNLIAVILLGISASFLGFILPLELSILIVSIATTHVFVSFLPSVFLGAPNEDDTALSILPGHELLMQGEGYSAIVYILYGCTIGLLLVILFSPIFYFFLLDIYIYVERIIPYILILTSCFLISFEKEKKLWAIIIFLLAGFLGLATLNLNINEPLLPLFTGLFGVSTLIFSISEKPAIPKQKIKKLSEIKIKKQSLLKAFFASMIAAPLCSFLPGLGTGQAAVIGSEVTGELDRKEFLILLGSVNTVVTGLAFVTLYSIGKARSGVSVAVNQLIDLNLNELYILTGAIIVVGIFSIIITLLTARIFSKLITKINYNLMSMIMIAFLIIISALFSNWLGIIVLAVSTILGLLCIKVGIRRTHLMGCLIIPSIILYLL